MAEILSQEEVNALSESISEGPFKEGKKGEGKEKTNPGAESSEYLEQREKVKTLLHDFYQERKKNMPVHREIAELAEKLKHIFEKVVLFFDKFYEDLESKVGENFCSGGDLPNRNEVIINWKQKEESGWQRINGIITDLQNILDKKGFNKELSEKEEKEISDLIKNIQEIDSKLNENVKKLWEIRKNTAKEIILASPEFSDFKDVELNTVYLNYGLYNLGSFVEAEKILETKEGKSGKVLFFNNDDWEIKEALENLTRKFNITEQELKEIKKLEFGAEHKNSLLGLRKAMETYDIEADKIVEIFCSLEGYEILKNGGENIKREFKEGKARFLYRKAKLPSIHEKRVIQQTMNGTFEFEELCKES